MHKVHKLDNAQTDTSYCTYYHNFLNMIKIIFNMIKNKGTHSKISNAFWTIPGIPHKEKETVIKYWSVMSRQIYTVPDLCCIVSRRSVESVGGVFDPVASYSCV